MQCGGNLLDLSLLVVYTAADLASLLYVDAFVLLCKHLKKCLKQEGVFFVPGTREGQLGGWGSFPGIRATL